MRARALGARRRPVLAPSPETRVTLTLSSSGFRSTKTPELCFRVLLTEGNARVSFHRKTFDRLGKLLAQR